MDGNERMDRLEALVAKIAEGTVVLMKRSDEHEEQMRQLKEIADRHEEHFGVLIRMMDELIRGRGKDKD
jgi:hypothetical protein